MAFDIKRNFTRISHGPTYVTGAGIAGGTSRAMQEGRIITDDAPSVVETAGYLGGVVDGQQNAVSFPVGLAIMVIMSASTTPVLKWYVVTVNDGANVITLVLQKTVAG